MKIRLLILITIFLASSFARAEHGSSEFLYQAGEGESYFQGSFDYLMHERSEETLISPRPPAESIKISDTSSFTDMNFQFFYEMGLSDMLALYASLGYGMGEGEVDAKGSPLIKTEANGLNSIDLGLKYRLSLGMGQVHVQGNLSLGFLEKNNGENRVSGSQALTFRLAYTMDYGSAMSGIMFDIGAYAGDKEFDDDDGKAVDPIKRKAGMALSAFYESMVAKGVLGGALSYSMGMGLLGAQNKSHLGGAFRDERVNLSVLDIRFYTRMPISDGVDFIGNLNYSMLLGAEKDSNNFTQEVKDLSNIGLGLGVRYMF